MTPLPEDKQRAWALDVFTEFLTISGLPPTRCPSPVDWLTLKGWLDAGIPLRVVLRAFRDATEGRKARPGSLAWFDKPVREAWARNLVALGTAEDVVPETQTQEEFDALLAGVRKMLADIERRP